MLRTRLRSKGGGLASFYPSALMELDFQRNYYRLGSYATNNFANIPGASVTGGAGFATAVNAAGQVIGPFASNTLPATDAGVEVWEARTNSLRNPTGLGAVVGTPGTAPTNWQFFSSGGMSFQVVGFGTDPATYLPYVDVRIYGTATGGSSQVLFETAGGISASTGQVWTVSTFARLVSGSVGTSWRIQVDPYNGPTYLTTYNTSAFAISSTSTSRPTFEVTLAAAGTTAFRPCISLSHANGEVVDVTLRLMAPNASQGSRINDPPILQTSNAAATRTALSPSITGLGSILTPPFTVLADISMPEADGIVRRVITLRNNGSGTLTLVRTATNELGIGSSDTSYVAISGFSGARTGKAALRVRTANRSLSFGGSAPLSVNNIALPTVERMDIGNVSGAGQLNGKIRRILILPDMTDAQLQALTA